MYVCMYLRTNKLFHFKVEFYFDWSRRRQQRENMSQLNGRQHQIRSYTRVQVHMSRRIIIAVATRKTWVNEKFHPHTWHETVTWFYFIFFLFYSFFFFFYKNPLLRVTRVSNSAIRFGINSAQEKKMCSQHWNLEATVVLFIYILYICSADIRIFKSFFHRYIHDTRRPICI